MEISESEDLTLDQLTLDRMEEDLVKIKNGDLTNVERTTDNLIAAMIKAGDQQDINSDLLKKNLVYIVGPSGSGKSTLLNYLAGKRLRVIDVNGLPRLELDDGEQGISAIGQGGQSTTIYPIIYEDEKEGLCYIDNPGNNDSRGLTQQILNSYVQYNVSNATEQNPQKVQIVTVVSYQYLSEHKRITFESVETLLKDFIKYQKAGMNHYSNIIIQNVYQQQRYALFVTPLEDDIDSLYVSPEGKGKGRTEMLRVINETGFSLITKNLLNITVDQSNYAVIEILITSLESKVSLQVSQLIIVKIQGTFIQTLTTYQDVRAVIAMNSPVLLGIPYYSQLASYLVEIDAPLGIYPLKKLAFFNSLLNRTDFQVPLDTVSIQNLFDEFNALVNMKPTAEKNSSGDTIYVRGYYLTLNQVVQCLQNFKSEKNIKEIQIQAVDTLFFDQSLDLAQLGFLGVSLSIIAPKWEITFSNLSIKIKGKPGQPPPAQKTKDSQNITAKENSFEDGSRGIAGSDGIPGTNGDNGPSLLGFVQAINSHKNSITLIAEGGDGGAGQEGQGGQDGQNGGKHSLKDNCNGGVNIDLFGKQWTNYHEWNYVSTPGYLGGVGGDGGKGGQGGFGGNPGDIQILQITPDYSLLQNSTYVKSFPNEVVKYSKNKGQNGPNGRGGQGGYGGQQGPTFSTWPEGVKLYAQYTYDGAYASNGQTPTDVVPNTNYPSVNNHLVSHDCVLKALDYLKSLLKASENNGKVNHSKNVFVAQISMLINDNRLKETKIRENEYIYNQSEDLFTKGNIPAGAPPVTQQICQTHSNCSTNELNLPFIPQKFQMSGLVQQFSNLCSIYQDYLLNKFEITTTDIQVIFSRFLEATTEYKALMENLLSKNDEYLFSLLYTSTCSILYGLKTKYTIVNFDYLGVVAQYDLPSYQNIVNQENKSIQYDEYNKSLEADKKESENLITTLENEIETAIDELDKAFEILKREISEEIDRQEEAIARAQSMAGIKLGLNLLKLVGSVASYFGPYGAAAGAVVNLGAGIAETVISPGGKTLAVKELSPVTYISTQTNNEKIYDPSKLIDTLVDVHEMEYKNNLDQKYRPDIEKQVYADSSIASSDKKNVANQRVDAQIESYTANNIGEYQASKDKYKTDLQNEYTKSTTEQFVTKYTKEVSTKYKTEKEKYDSLPFDKKVEYEKMSREYDKAKTLNWANHITAISTTALQTVAIFNQYLADRQAVEAQQKSLSALKESEKQVHAFIDQVSNDIDKSLAVMSEDLSEASTQAIVDYQEYTIKVQLASIDEYFQNTLKNFDYAEKYQLFSIINKMKLQNEALTKIYTRKLDIEDQQNFALFITNVSNNAGINSSDSKEVVEMRKVLQQNVILKEASSMLYSLKQYYYPFGFDSSYQPSSGSIEDTLKATINLIKAAYKDKQLQKYAITAYREFYQYGYFLSKTQKNGLGPFFTWEGLNYSSTIIELLRGKEVILESTPKYFQTGHDAIKFNEVHIEFDLSNEQNANVLNQLTQDLSKYKVELRTNGIYHYRFNDIYYDIPGDELELYYQYAIMTNDPNHYKQLSLVNDPYKVIKEGDYIFSPYTTWKVKLVPIDPNNNNLLQKYEKYAHQLNLNLTGYAQAINITAFDGKIKQRAVHSSYQEFVALDIVRA